jgi:hypothetical protein
VYFVRDILIVDHSCVLFQEMRLKMDEDLEKRTIETMPVVISQRFHTADAKNKSDYHVNLRCGCGVNQVGPIRMSSKRPLPPESPEHQYLFTGPIPQRSDLRHLHPLDEATCQPRGRSHRSQNTHPCTRTRGAALKQIHDMGTRIFGSCLDIHTLVKVYCFLYVYY